MAEPLQDLASRFTHARRAALRAVLPDSTPEEREPALLARALPEHSAAVLRGVFDNALRLGMGFARFYDKEFALGELPTVLEELDSPCLRGAWRVSGDEPGVFLERKGCVYAELGASACDYWREAADGLILGITGGMRHARHASVGHGDGCCLDVIMVRPESPLRFGAIPEAVRTVLEGIQRLAKSFDSSSEIEFLGVSEGTLYYEMKRAGREGGVATTSLVERALARRLPELKSREISPRAVFSADKQSEHTPQAKGSPNAFESNDSGLMHPEKPGE